MSGGEARAALLAVHLDGRSALRIRILKGCPHKRARWIASLVRQISPGVIIHPAAVGTERSRSCH